MKTIEFKIYRDQRIQHLRDAYADSPDQHSEDLNVRESWLELRRCWNSHADAVLTYATEHNIDDVMDCWRAVVDEGRYRNEHEGIGLNAGLSTENVEEILAVSRANHNMHWLTQHLKNHPNHPNHSDTPQRSGDVRLQHAT